MNSTSVYANMELVIFIIIALVGVFGFLTLGQYISLWFQAYVSGSPIPLSNIIGMSLRKIPYKLIVNCRITLYKAGIRDVTVSDLETHVMAGGNIANVVAAFIAADKANITLTWRQATAIDLAGRDILEAVRTSVNPKVIDCPNSGNHFITAVSRNGIQLLCKARVTVRTNIAQLVGGATEETIIARVGEGIVNAIGSSETHSEVLAAPQVISHRVLERGLDAQTAFSILSIDIAELDVGENIGARLSAEQAETNKTIAQAKAEERRAMAVALEQENTAQIKLMQAKVFEAEAQVPKAIAEAYRSGHLGVIDGLRIRNLQADTEMRANIARPKPN